jgi:hypothetical protein
MHRTHLEPFAGEMVRIAKLRAVEDEVQGRA